MKDPMNDFQAPSGRVACLTLVWMAALLLGLLLPGRVSGAALVFENSPGILSVWKTTADLGLEGNSMILSATPEAGVRFVFVSDPPTDGLFSGNNVRGEGVRIFV